MLRFVSNTEMVVAPKTKLDPTALTAAFGVSTALLFDNALNQNLDTVLFPGAGELAKIKVRDVADMVANPMLHNTSNTDCISCHTETTRRQKLNLTSQPGMGFSQPAGISGVDPSLLPKDVWNVRDFGWGLAFFAPPRGFAPTITQRAANEAAESADTINKIYLSPPPVGEGTPK